MPRNTLRSRLQSGEVVGVISGHHSTDMVDWMGQYRPDAIWMECEHGPGSWEEIADFSRACDLWGCASIVRVMSGDAGTITRTLDRGASGIVVPHVNTREQAQAIATASRFGPLGLRGMFGSRRSYGVVRDDELASLGADRPEYISAVAARPQCTKREAKHDLIGSIAVVTRPSVD